MSEVNDRTSTGLSPELSERLSKLWATVIEEPKRPDPEFVLVGRLNQPDSVLIKLAGGDEAYCRSEENFLKNRDVGIWTDYAVMTFENYKAHVR